MNYISSKKLIKFIAKLFLVLKKDLWCRIRFNICNKSKLKKYHYNIIYVYPFSILHAIVILKY